MTMPVPTDEASIDATVSLPQSFDNSHCNTAFSDNYGLSRGIPHEIPIQGEIYNVHVNSGDSFQVPNPDGTLQNLTGPTTVQLFAANGVPPPIIAPPGYMLQYTEEGVGGAKHIRILPLMEPQNSYVGSPTVPHHHQPPIPMQSIHHAHVHPAAFPANVPMVPGYRPDGHFFQQPMLYAETAGGGYSYRVQPQCVPVTTVAGGQICPDSPYASVLRPQSCCESELNPNVRITALSEEINEVGPLTQPIILHVCTCGRGGCKDSFLNSSSNSQFSIPRLRDQFQENSNNSKAFNTNDMELAASRSAVAYSEMSDSSLNSMQHSQAANAAESHMSSGHPGMLEPNEWPRGGPEHHHLQQSVPSDSPTRTSSSMASSSPSASSMTSSPRNSPNPFQSNGHKSSRSPLRHSPSAKPYRPPGQIQGLLPTVSGLTHHPVHPQRDPQGSDDPSASDGSLSVTEESDQQSSTEPRLLENLMELLRTVTKPEIKHTDIRCARIAWDSLSLDNTAPELKEKVEACGITYDLHLSESKKTGKYATVYQGSKHEYLVEKLRPGFDYAVRLYAICDKRKGPPSQATTFRTQSTAPDPPVAPKVQKATKEFLHLKWMPSQDNGERIFKYYLEIDDGIKPSFRLVYSGSNKNFKVTKLVPSHPYNFRLASENKRGKSEWSPIVTYHTSGVAPPVPQPPQLKSASIESLSLVWFKPVEDVTSFSLEMNDEKTGYGFIPKYNGPEVMYTVKNLTRMTDYKFRLKAQNSFGSSNYSQVVVHGTHPDKPQPPGKPRVKGNVHPRSVTLIWAESLMANYRATRRSGGGIFSQLLPEGGASGAPPWELEAQKLIGASEKVTTISDPSEGDPIGRDKTVVIDDAPRDDGGSEVVGYKVEKAKCDDQIFVAVYEGLNRECIAKDLEPGQLHHFRVLSLTSNDCSLPSGALSITTRPVLPGPCEPPSLALRPKPNCITIKWELPSHTGGAEILNYEVNYKSVKDLNDEPSTGYAGSKAECTIGDLSPGSKYSFAVRAANEIGFGGWSERMEVVTAPGPPSKPNVPEANVLSANSIHLNWKAPLSNGAEVNKYLLQWGAAEAPMTNYSTRGPVRTYEFNTLSPNTAYFYSIRAINSVGTGPASAVASATTLPSIPDRVTNLRQRVDAPDGSPVTARRVSVNWDAARDNGSEIVSYKVHVSVDATPDDSSPPSSVTHDVEANVRTFNAVDLSPDTDYRLKVCAINNIGVGLFSSTLVLHTKPLPPNAPDLSCVQYGYNCLRLKWNTGSKVASGTQYLLQKILKKESGKKLHTIYRGTDNSHLVNGLSEQTDYGFRVCASNSEGPGPFTTQYFKTKIQSPAAIKGPVVKNLKSTGCHVTWQKCNKIKGDPIFYHFVLQTQGKVILEKDLDDTKYLLANLVPNTTYQTSIATVRRLSRRETTLSPQSDILTDEGEDVDLEKLSQALGEISAPASPLIAFHTLNGSSTISGVPTLAPLVVPTPVKAKEISEKSGADTVPQSKLKEAPSLTENLQKSVSKFLYDDDNITYRQMIIFYVCAITFAFFFSLIYI